MTDDHAPHARRGGPPLLAPGLAWAALTVAAAVLHPGTRPGAAPEATLGLLLAHPVAAALSTLALLVSAFPFAVWSAAVHHRLHRLGLRVAGPTLGHTGGVLAAGLLAVSAVVGWGALAVAGAPGAATVAAALTEVSFAAGGPAFAVAFGLLMAGVSVPVLMSGLVPRPLAVAGLVLSGVSVVAVFALVVPVLGVLLPVVRFGGLVWLVWISATLPISRRRVAVPAGSVEEPAA